MAKVCHVYRVTQSKAISKVTLGQTLQAEHAHSNP